MLDFLLQKILDFWRETKKKNLVLPMSCFMAQGHLLSLQKRLRITAFGTDSNISDAVRWPLYIWPPEGRSARGVICHTQATSISVTPQQALPNVAFQWRGENWSFNLFFLPLKSAGKHSQRSWHAGGQALFLPCCRQEGRLWRQVLTPELCVALKCRFLPSSFHLACTILLLKGALWF